MRINSSIPKVELFPSAMSGKASGYSDTASVNAFTEYLKLKMEAPPKASAKLQLDGLIKPTFEDLERISDEVSGALVEQFHQSGIPTKPQIDIIYNVAKNEIDVKGSREDNAEIKQLIESEPGLLEKIRTLNAVASHVCEMPEHLAFQQEYLASHDPETIIMKYSHLLCDDPKPHELMFKFDTNGIDIYYDGEYWVYF